MIGGAMVDPTLPPNCTCINCGKRFRRIPYHIARRKREGRPTTCSNKCTYELKKLDKYLDTIDYDLANAIRIRMEVTQ